MEKEIKINGSRLKLVKYCDYEYGKSTEIILRNKKNLKYQYVLLADKLSSSGNPWLIMDSYGKNKIRDSLPLLWDRNVDIAFLLRSARLLWGNLFNPGS